MAKIITPVVTVFDRQEKPDYSGNQKVIDFLIENGVDGILVLGSTGEFPGLSIEEKKKFFQFYIDYTAGRIPLYAGTCCMNFQETVELSTEVLKMGYAAPLIIGPYYYGMDQEKLFLYYDTLAKSLDGNLFIYNFPARSGHSIAPKTVQKLVETNSNITGLKDSVSEPGHTNLICLATENYPFSTFSGFDDQFLYNLSSGGAGCIGGLSNIVPDLWSDLVRSTNKKDFDRTIRLSHLIFKLMPIYDMDANCSLLLKKLMIHRGVDIAPTSVFPYNQIEEKIYRRAETLLNKVLSEYQKA